MFLVEKVVNRDLEPNCSLPKAYKYQKNKYVNVYKKRSSDVQTNIDIYWVAAQRILQDIILKLRKIWFIMSINSRKLDINILTFLDLNREMLR